MELRDIVRAYQQTRNAGRDVPVELQRRCDECGRQISLIYRSARSCDSHLLFAIPGLRLILAFLNSAPNWTNADCDSFARSIRAAAIRAGVLPAKADKPADKPTRQRRTRSAERGGAELKPIAALSKHHKYSEAGCLNQEPIAVRELARKAGVTAGSASKFFKRQFLGYAAYRRACRDSLTLAVSLRLLNEEIRPKNLLGNRDVAVTEADLDGE